MCGITHHSNCYSFVQSFGPYANGMSEDCSFSHFANEDAEVWHGQSLPRSQLVSGGAEV